MLAREAVDRALETSLHEGLLFERRAFHSLFSTHDQKKAWPRLARNVRHISPENSHHERGFYRICQTHCNRRAER